MGVDLAQELGSIGHSPRALAPGHNFRPVVWARGLVPPLRKEPDPKSGASAIPPRARWEEDGLEKS